MSNIIQILIQAKDEASQKLKDVGHAAETSGKQSEKAGGGFGSLTGSFVLGNLAATGITKALGFMGDQLGDVFKATGERERGLAQLNNVIKSTGDVSGVTAKQATELADSIQNTTAIDNDAAQAAENMLLTFTNIGKETFPSATRAVTDMATAMNNGLTPSGEQLSSTAIQIGKALNDPINGVTALQRVGVKMTETQKAQIETMVKHGDTMGAQKIILKELNTEFGGSAAAALNTYAGRQAQVKNAITDAKVEIGLTINKALLPLQEALAKFVSGDKFKRYLAEVVGFTQDLIRYVGEATKFYLAHNKVINEAAKIFIVVVGTVLAVVEAIKLWRMAEIALKAVQNTNPWILALTAVIIVIMLIIDHWKQITAVFKKGMDDVKKWFKEGVDFIKAHWDILLVLMLGPLGFFIGQVIKHWGEIKKGATDAFNGVKEVVTTVLGFIWGSIIKPVIDTVAAAFHIWWKVVSYVFDVIRGLAIVAWNYIYANIIKPVIDMVTNSIRFWANVFSDVMNWIMGTARSAWAIIWGIISPIYNAIRDGMYWVGSVITNVWAWITDKAGSAWGWVIAHARNAWNWVVGIWNGAVGWFNGVVNGISNIFGRVSGAISGAFSSAMSGAKGIVSGAMNWIIDKVNGVIRTVNNTAGKLPGVPKIGEIPRLYTGATNWRGGLAVVGDINGKGGELIDLPRGSNVYSNAQSKQIMNSMSSNTTIQNVWLGDGSAVKEFFSKMDTDNIRISKGLSPARGF